jgi:hypothetical protein
MLFATCQHFLKTFSSFGKRLLRRLTFITLSLFLNIVYQMILGLSTLFQKKFKKFASQNASKNLA